MTKKKNQTFIIFVFLTLIFISGQCVIDRDYPIDLKNSSERKIQVSAGITGENTYPDTGLHHKPLGITIYPGQKISVAGGRMSWEKIFETVPSDTMSFVLFDVDTLNFYDWRIIQEQYKVLQRYDLSIYDLQKLDYTLYFPPNEAMRNMKMFPKYGTVQ